MNEPHAIVEVDDQSVAESFYEKPVMLKRGEENATKYSFSNKGFNLIWDQAVQAKIPTIKNQKRKDNQKKVKAQRNEGALPGDLTKQYSQVIDEANKISLNQDLEDARRTVHGLPNTKTSIGFDKKAILSGTLNTRLQNFNQK